MNSGERIDYSPSLCQVSINASSLLMVGPLVKPVELIPRDRDSFPRCSAAGSFKCAMLWRGPMVSKTLKQLLGDTVWGDLDFLIIDTPPGTGDTHLTLLQQYEVSGAVIVTTPQKIALSDVQKAISMFQGPHFPVPVYGIVENMAWFSPTLHPEEKYFLFGQGGGDILSQTFHVPLLARIPMNETICRSCDEGKLNELFSDPEVKNGFDQLLSQILTQTEKTA